MQGYSPEVSGFWRQSFDSQSKSRAQLQARGNRLINERRLVVVQSREWSKPMGSFRRSVNRSPLLRFLPAAILMFAAAVPGLAQSTNSGDFRGTVTDQSGAVVPGAK